MLVLKNIVKKIGEREVLKNINAEFQGGINFILGPSGSGKSTLLKIIGGMDKEFYGDVVYKEKSIKAFEEADLNDYHYNSIGFIWQNFQLLNHLTVKENVKVVLSLSDLSNKEKDKKVQAILSKLDINKLANKKVGKLSGGQKQRVAIARALVKNPEVIIADEPTGSLDKNSTKTIMEVLRKIAKDKMVIVVTHDKSLVDDQDNCFYLKDGIMYKVQEGKSTKDNTVKKQNIKPHLSLSNAISQGIRNFKGFAFKFVLTSIILAVSTYLLALNIGGSIGANQEKIMTSFGQSVTDDELRSLDIFANSNVDNEEGSKQILDIINKYENDSRVEHLLYNYTVLDPNIYVEGKNIMEKETNETKKGSTMAIDINQTLYKGRMPQAGKKEIAIPKGIPNAENLIGKKISIKGNIVTEAATESSDAVFTDFEIEDFEVVGVIDNSGQMMYLVNSNAAKSLMEKYNPIGGGSLTIKIKERKDILTIANEIMDEHPNFECTGAFEFLKDMSILEGKTKEQSSSVLTLISILALSVTLIITILNAYLRKSEYAIFKINGYSKNGLIKLSIVEYVIISIIPIPIVIAVSFFMGVNIPLSIGILFLQGTIMGVIAGILAGKSNVLTNLSIGDRK